MAVKAAARNAPTRALFKSLPDVFILKKFKTSEKGSVKQKAKTEESIRLNETAGFIFVILIITAVTKCPK